MRVEVTNLAALDALRDVAEALESMAEDFPWREDVQDAVERMEYAIAHLKPADGKP